MVPEGLARRFGVETDARWFWAGCFLPGRTPGILSTVFIQICLPPADSVRGPLSKANPEYSSFRNWHPVTLSGDLSYLGRRTGRWSNPRPLEKGQTNVNFLFDKTNNSFCTNFIRLSEVFYPNPSNLQPQHLVIQRCQQTDSIICIRECRFGVVQITARFESASTAGLIWSGIDLNIEGREVPVWHTSPRNQLSDSVRSAVLIAYA